MICFTLRVSGVLSMQTFDPGLQRTKMLECGCIWSTLNTGPLNLMPLMVYPKLLFHPNFSIKSRASQ